jgi:hypothetical protein
MIISKLLRIKAIFTLKDGTRIMDLISSTFKFNDSNSSLGPVLVKSEEAMRPDLLAERIYSNHEKWDVILKFNGISNPFSLDEGEILLAPSDNTMGKMIISPRQVPEKGTEPAKANEERLVKPKTPKDKKRLAALKNKISEVTPPNVNMSGESNVRIVNGRVIFGGNMTVGGNVDTNQSINRSRVENQIKNTTNF